MCTLSMMVRRAKVKIQTFKKEFHTHIYSDTFKLNQSKIFIFSKNKKKKTKKLLADNLDQKIKKEATRWEIS